MEIHADKSTSKTNRLVPFTVGWMAILSMLLWLVGFFRLTKEDRVAAGICVKGEMQDE